MNELSVDVGVGPGREALEDHDGGNKEQLLADVEHELGRAGRHEVDDVLHRRHVAFAAVDLRKINHL